MKGFHSHSAMSCWTEKKARAKRLSRWLDEGKAHDDDSWYGGCHWVVWGNSVIADGPNEQLDIHRGRVRRRYGLH